MSLSKDRNRDKDLAALADAFFDNLTIGRCEYGGIGLDDKRPFGNSSVNYDMWEIIEPDVNWDDLSESDFDYVRTLYHEHLIPYLKERWATIPKTDSPA